jgi:hypothetical protein
MRRAALVRQHGSARCCYSETEDAGEVGALQVLYLPVEERFYVKIIEDACALYPEGAFSTIPNYPVYALRLREANGQDITEFFIPGSDGEFVWMDKGHTRLARR